MMKQRPIRVALLTALVTGAVAMPTSAATKMETPDKTVKPTSNSERPVAAPGWIVIAEEWFLPLRFESAEALHQARVHYRHGEERAAANELRKAVSWLRLAAGHAQSKTKQALEDAAICIDDVATQLFVGNLVAAKKLDGALSKASHALAEWHYFKAKENLAGKEDGKSAAEHLTAAVNHLRFAASSADFEYGEEVIELFDGIEAGGKSTRNADSINPNKVSANLAAVEKAIANLADVLKRAK